MNCFISLSSPTFTSTFTSSPPAASTCTLTTTNPLKWRTSTLPFETNVRCDTSPVHTTILTPADRASSTIQSKQQQQEELQKSIDQHHQWRYAIQPGSVVETWTHGALSFSVVQSLYDKGVNTCLATVKPDQTVALDLETTKISFGEIISVWSSTLVVPASPEENGLYLVDAVQNSLNFLRTASPKAISLTKVYASMRRLPKLHLRSSLSSSEICHALFNIKPSHKAIDRAALTVATATLLAADNIHFKRSQPGHGWRALPPSVAVSRGRLSFIDACQSILEVRRIATDTDGNPSRSMTVWSREHLEFIRDLEVIAASGSAARGTSAAILQALGYRCDDDGAANLLLDINYWTTGKFGAARLRKGLIKMDENNQNKSTASKPAKSQSNSETVKNISAQREQQQQRERDDTEWTCSPSLLAEARELRTATRERRRAYMDAPDADTSSKYQNKSAPRRRSLLHPREGQVPLRAYCIDDKSTRFLDDAVSVRVVGGGSIVRLWLHIADVDEIIRSGSALDEFAKERGQSMYLPLKPLHMLPMAVMEAASFSNSYPTEAITVMLECDIEKDVVRNWEVFPSVVPPVTRINYDQFDLAMEHGADAANLDDETYHDLKYIAYVAPLLAEKIDLRKSSKKIRELRKSEPGNEQSMESVTESGRLRVNGLEGFDDKPIASVRLVKQSVKAGVRGIGRTAKVVNFQTTGSHQVVNEILTCAGGIMRQFARENRAYLPEGRDAFLYAGRCGTAPLRRYSDLAVQRQIKCVLFGRQPAGKRRMDELKVWLAKRHAAAEKTVSERRRGALFDSFSSFCSQKCAATGAARATVRGLVRNVVVTKKGVVRAEVALDGTGLLTTAAVSPDVEVQMFGSDEDTEYETASGGKTDGVSKQEWKLTRARGLLTPHTQVQVEIEHVDTVAYNIQAHVLRTLD